MKRYILITVIISFILMFSRTLYAKTNFTVKRKSLNKYEKYDIKEIINTDSKRLKYESSDESVATISEDGIIFTKKQGEFEITVSDENTTDSCKFSSGYFVGIDVSSTNGIVSWKKVKDQGIDFAMIRSTVGWYDEIEDADQKYDFQFDKQFLNNIKGATENNISFGVYHLCLALTPEQAEMEAEYVLTALEEYASEYKDKMSLPIAYDIEVDSLQKLTKAQVTQIAIAFCSKIYDAGYVPIVYSNTNFFRNYLDMDKLNALAYNLWYAWYQDNPNYSDKVTIANTNVFPFMWQYTSKGSVDGANNSYGNVDMNILYMKERVKVEVKSDGQVVDIIGANKGEKIDIYPNIEKKGYNLIGFEDNSGNNINDNYIFNFDTQINAIFEKIKITNIILDKENINIDDIKEYKLNVSASPTNAVIEEGDITFISSDKSVAVVNNKGIIIPKGKGNCKIRCYLNENENIYAECNINVDIEYAKGDMNKDGKINATDAAMVLDRYKYKNATEEDMQIGDINNDGKLNATDAALILDIYKNNK